MSGIRRKIGLCVVGLALATAVNVCALESGTDIVVPAAARGAGAGNSMWVTSLFILNPGNSAVNVTIAWLVRNSGNPNPETVQRTVPAGEVLVLDDPIADLFGHSSGGGAFRITAPSPVVVNAGIFNRAGGSEFGQGFEGIPVSRAFTAGSATQALGVSSDSNYRTNFYLVDTSGSSSRVTVSLVDADGTVRGSKSYTLDPWEPILKPVTEISGQAVTSGMVSFQVTSGSVLLGTSRVNSGTGDPLTLAAWSPTSSGGGGGDGWAPASLAGRSFDLVVSASEGSGLAVDRESMTVTMSTDTSATIDWSGGFTATFDFYKAGGNLGLLVGDIPEWQINNLHVVMEWTSATGGNLYGGATDYDATGINVWGTFTVH